MKNYIVWKRDNNDEHLLIQILNEQDLLSVEKEFTNKGYVIVNKFSDHYFGEIFLEVIREGVKE